MKTTKWLQENATNFEKLHEFGMKHGVVVNCRDFYEADRIIPDAIYPIQAEYVDGFEDCPKCEQSLEETCKALGIDLFEYDGWLYLDTPQNRQIIASFST